MMYVKVMGSQNKADKDQSKEYSLHECIGVRFCVDNKHGAFAMISPNGINEYVVYVPGNVYVLNQDGKTIDCWAPNSNGPVKHLLTEGVDPTLLKS